MNIQSTAVAIGSTAIRQHNGLYSLNDLHRASGGEDKHKPANFIRLDTTQALIKEIEQFSHLSTEIQCADSRTAVETVNGGQYRGTYACRELVIAYAAWISAEFQLKVIRVFLAHADSLPADRPAAPLPPPQAQPLPFPPPVSPSPAPTKTLTFTVPVGGNDHRWLLHTDRYGREHVTPLSHDTHIGTPDELVNTLMHSPADLHLSLEQQLTLASTFLRNAHQSAAGYGKRLKPLTGV